MRYAGVCAPVAVMLLSALLVDLSAGEELQSVPGGLSPNFGKIDRTMCTSTATGVSAACPAWENKVGREALACLSKARFFCVYDIESGLMSRVPHFLIGVLQQHRRVRFRDSHEFPADHECRGLHERRSKYGEKKRKSESL